MDSPKQAMQPEFESMVELTLSLAHRSTVDEALEVFLERMEARPHLCGGGLWLIDRYRAADRRGKTPMLRLRGLRLSCEGVREAWEREEGSIERLELGSVPIGLAAERAQVLRIGEQSDLPVPGWMKQSKLEALVAAPLLDGEQVLGVLVFFFQRDVSLRARAEGRKWVRILADHFATAVRNERAHGEIEELQAQLEAENRYLREEINRALQSGTIVGDSVGMQRVLDQVGLVASTDASVLLQGESGTGKELVAGAIHASSPRSARPLIRVNCAGVPRELFESEFFGHVRGAFTGAVRDREGRFELADGGTLFLDEVGEIPLDLQGKLLRVLQEGSFERIGEERTRHVDVRVIAATNVDLARAVDEGGFRRDLFFRISVFPITIPPLRDRPEDIPALARHILDQAASRLGLPHPPLRQGEVMLLQEYDWPGNVRELQNILERALILSGGRHLNLAPLLRGHTPTVDRLPGSGGGPGEQPSGQAQPDQSGDRVLSEEQMRAFERENLRRALRRCRGQVGGRGGAAELLGLPPTTLRSRIARDGLEEELQQAP